MFGIPYEYIRRGIDRKIVNKYTDWNENIRNFDRDVCVCM